MMHSWSEAQLQGSGSGQSLGPMQGSCTARRRGMICIEKNKNKGATGRKNGERWETLRQITNSPANQSPTIMLAVSVVGLTYSHSPLTPPSLLDVVLALPSGSRTLLIGANGGLSSAPLGNLSDPSSGQVHPPPNPRRQTSRHHPWGRHTCQGPRCLP